MFVLDVMDLTLRNGVSPDRIPKAISNRFSFHLDGYERIDNRLAVRISPRQIRFFYYDYDYGEKEYDPNGIKDNTYVKEVGFVSLTRRKETGNDILAFPQNINELNLLKLQNGKGIADEIHECNKKWREKFGVFPFAEKFSYNEDKPEDNPRELFRTFLRFSLLCFVYEIEDRGMAFGSSPIYDKVRDKLRESDVYNMLSAKLHYTMYLYNGDNGKCKHYSQNREKYTYYTQRFADRLMDKNLNKVIPPDNYGFSEDKQGWFYNPEEELEQLLKTNRQQESVGAATLKVSLVSKIRSFLYTKHSVFNANTSTKSKKCFTTAQIIMCLFNVVYVVALLGFKWQFWDWFYGSFWPICLSAFFLVTFFLLRSAYFNGKEYINAFFLRIVVAELAAWLTIGVAEDLVKSMLWTERPGRIILAMIFVLVLVGILIFGEARQHSPYFKKGENITKILLVLNHSIFFALILGILMQSVFYDNLLKTSNVLSEVVYKKHFDQVDNYLQRLDGLEKAIDDYQSFIQEYDMGSMSISGDNEGRLDTKIKINDTTEYGFTAKLRFQSSLINSLDKKNEIVDYHNKLVEAIDNCRMGLIKNVDSITHDTILYCENLTTWSRAESESVRDTVSQENLRRIGLELPDLRMEIQSIKVYLSNEDHDTLLKWATVPSEENTEVFSSIFLKSLKRKDKCCRMVGWKWWKPSNSRFYPTLLIMHTLIVLVLAFITQLIISDKSVTEPL